MVLELIIVNRLVWYERSACDAVGFSLSIECMNLTTWLGQAPIVSIGVSLIHSRLHFLLLDVSLLVCALRDREPLP